MKRYAIIRNADSRRQIDAYLPDNYKVIHESDDEHNGRPGRRSLVFVIEGVDYAGWGLDSYVIPRCGSGLIWVEEIDLSHPIMKQIEQVPVRRSLEQAIECIDAGDLDGAVARIAQAQDALKPPRKPHVHVDQDRYLDVIDEVGGEAMLEDVAQFFDVSETTAKRNLDGLVAQGKLDRRDRNYSLSAATTNDIERGSG